ncbi:hypothetical protein [Streptomyces sp. NBRC 109706]|uniref:hypothetical protein n=1 Tax=Streptomyces sp. NBRC 109706 TaxID=1550035 RepID=UPI001F41A385|nr:hypothetical protein [Streptomyces sp. NBRC 109706]
MELLSLLGTGLLASLLNPLISGRGDLLVDMDAAEAARLHHTAVFEAAQREPSDLALEGAVTVSHGCHLGPRFHHA